MDCENESKCCETSGEISTRLIKPDIREGLSQRKSRLEKSVAELDAAIKALDANPEIAKVLELVGRASRH